MSAAPRKPLHIALAGPMATQDMAARLGVLPGALPRGYSGAPLLCSLAAELLQRGHRVSLITLTSDMSLSAPPLVHQHSSMLSITYCPMRPKAWPLNGVRLGRIVDLYAFERAHLRRAIQAAAPELVHAHWAGEFALAALRTGLPCVVTHHDDPWAVARYSRRWREKAYRWLRAGMAWRVLRRARHMTAVSPTLAAVLARRTRTPLHVVPNPVLVPVPVPVSVPVSSLACPAVPTGPRVLVVAHGFDRLKNVAAAMLAFEQFAATQPQAELVLLGHGFGPGEAAQAWWGQRAARVRFVGAVAHAQVAHWMASSTVLLHPSLTESFGMVVAEAMAVALPVVVGQGSGALPWLVGEHGWLTDVTSSTAMAQVLAQVCSQREEARRRAALGAAAVALRFGVVPVVDTYEALYAQLLAA